MPCYDPEPTGRDMRAYACAKLIVGLIELGYMPKEVEAERVAEGSYEILFTAGPLLDEFTEKLCTFCRTQGDDFIIKNCDKRVFRELANWWEDHQKVDAATQPSPRSNPGGMEPG